jgi:RNA polymerase sigma-70 factor, ECF subfamily
MIAASPRHELEQVYCTESRRVLATLIRLLGGFEAAEEALHDAFAAAAEQWPQDGVPSNPYAWLVSAGRFKAIDRFRRQARLARAMPELTAQAEVEVEMTMHESIVDDELRLMFICCHPALPPDARIALTLREVGGLTTEEIARAYLTRTPTIAQRIVRAKAKIRDEALPYEVPDKAEWPARFESVLRVIYLIFNESYAATGGPALIRTDLAAEAIRLGRLQVELTGEPEASGLLALMLLHDARKEARADAEGNIILLEDQDRSMWNRTAIAEACALIDKAMKRESVGPYLLQAAIAAVHSRTPAFDQTNWSEIVSLYDDLLKLDPSPVAALNRAVALGMRDGAQTGLAEIDKVMKDGKLDDYHLAHAARGDMQRRLQLFTSAQLSYNRALDLTQQAAERRFLAKRLAQVSAAMKKSKAN